MVYKGAADFEIFGWFLNNGGKVDNKQRQVLLFLNKAGTLDLPAYKIVEGVKSILSSEYDLESLAELIHSTTCTRHSGKGDCTCNFYIEHKVENSWEMPCRKKYLDIAVRMAADSGMKQKAIADTIIALHNVRSADPLMYVTKTFIKLVEEDDESKKAVDISDVGDIALDLPTGDGAD